MKHNHGRKKPGTRLIQAGLLLMAAAFMLAGYNLWDEWRAGIAAARVLEKMAVPLRESFDAYERAFGAQEQEIPDYILNPDMEMPTMEIDGNEYIGVLEIPSLDLSFPVISRWSNENLKTAPCRYEGSAYGGNFVIAGHNYRTHFGPLSGLLAGDRVAFTDVDGNVFNYDVAEIQILEPTAVEEMVADDWDLSLFTCTLGGQTRLTVRCLAVETDR